VATDPPSVKRHEWIETRVQPHPFEEPGKPSSGAHLGCHHGHLDIDVRVASFSLDQPYDAARPTQRAPNCAEKGATRKANATLLRDDVPVHDRTGPDRAWRSGDR